jgi:hypothetical protein
VSVLYDQEHADGMNICMPICEASSIPWSAAQCSGRGRCEGMRGRKGYRNPLKEEAATYLKKGAI